MGQKEIWKNRKSNLWKVRYLESFWELVGNKWNHSLELVRIINWLESFAVNRGLEHCELWRLMSVKYSSLRISKENEQIKIINLPRVTLGPENAEQEGKFWSDTSKL